MNVRFYLSNDNEIILNFFGVKMLGFCHMSDV